jgi:GNAT superfamily N-acetyltransferase
MEGGETEDVRKVFSDLYRPGDEIEIIALNRMEYGPTDILATQEDFHWRYAQNPAGQAIICVIRDLNSGSVVGFIWIVPLRIRIHGQGRLAAIGTDLVIHPEYRNTFGYARLMRRFWQVFRDHHIPLHCSFLSEETYRRQQEKHPQTVSTIPLLVKPLDFEGLARTYFTKTWQRFFVRRACWLVPQSIFRQRQLASGGEITVQLDGKFDHSFDQFWSEVRDKYPITIERDRAFLAWRFAGVSGRRYHILVARRRNQMLGYLVLRCSTIRGVKAALVMDLLVSESPWGDTAGACLLAEAEAYFRSEGMSVAAGLMAPLAAEHRVLYRAGYRSLPIFVAPRAFRFGLFVHNPSDRDLIPLSAQDWFITLADNESF